MHVCMSNEIFDLIYDNLQLESDMFVLRGLLNELRNISDNLRDDSTESVNLGPGIYLPIFLYANVIFKKEKF